MKARRSRGQRGGPKRSEGGKQLPFHFEVPNLQLPDPISPAHGNPRAAWYGQVAYCLSWLAAVFYLAWAFLPEGYLEACGISWYPQRSVRTVLRHQSLVLTSEWALLVPSWLTMAVVFVYLAYGALNIYDTPRSDSLAQIVDNQGHIQTLSPTDRVHPLVRNSYLVLPQGAIPALNDMPVGLMNDVMFASDSEGE
jgi:hypothetical protein